VLANPASDPGSRIEYAFTAGALPAGAAVANENDTIVIGATPKSPASISTQDTCLRRHIFHFVPLALTLAGLS
jgi:hypothetical protein